MPFSPYKNDTTKQIEKSSPLPSPLVVAGKKSYYKLLLPKESDLSIATRKRDGTLDTECLSPSQKFDYNFWIKKATALKAKTNKRNYEVAFHWLLNAAKIHCPAKLFEKLNFMHKMAMESLDGYTLLDDGFLQNKSKPSAEFRLPGGLVVPSTIYNSLYSYQREGIKWMWELFIEAKGGILGDDMGLGKTVQTASFITCMFAAKLIERVLLVMPVAVIMHWQKECSKWCENVPVRVFHGTSKKKRQQDLTDTFVNGGICITTYGLVTTSAPLLNKPIEDVEECWDYIILDEGHKIKNPSIKLSKEIRKIRSNIKIILSGTPIQNNLNEMWALFDFICPSKLLGSLKSFQLQFVADILRSQHRDATEKEVVEGNNKADLLATIIAPYFLRREKSQLQNNINATSKYQPASSTNTALKQSHGPPKLEARKNDFIVWVYLAAQQLELYERFLNSSEITEVLNQSRSPLAAISVLKRICDHPNLVRKSASLLSASSTTATAMDTLNSALFEIPSTLQEVIEQSGKLVVLVELLKSFKEEGHRVLIFSQSTKMLDIIQQILESYLNFQFLRIDGSVSKIAERQKRIRKFEKADSTYDCFLLTTQVGGMGISLTSADRVVIFDPSWNDIDDQAADRVYRLGQTKNVIIYRLITCGTIEEKIYRKQIFKTSLIRSVIKRPPKTQVQVDGDEKIKDTSLFAIKTPAKAGPKRKQTHYRYFTADELKQLFQLDNPRQSETQLQLAKIQKNFRKTDEQLEKHIAFLSSLPMFGISDHDLMFCPQLSGKIAQLYQLDENRTKSEAAVTSATTGAIEFSDRKQQPNYCTCALSNDLEEEPVLSLKQRVNELLLNAKTMEKEGRLKESMALYLSALEQLTSSPFTTTTTTTTTTSSTSSTGLIVQSLKSKVIQLASCLTLLVSKPMPM